MYLGAFGDIPCRIGKLAGTPFAYTRIGMDEYMLEFEGVLIVVELARPNSDDAVGSAAV